MYKKKFKKMLNCVLLLILVFSYTYEHIIEYQHVTKYTAKYFRFEIKLEKCHFRQNRNNIVVTFVNDVRLFVCYCHRDVFLSTTRVIYLFTNHLI